MVSMRDQQLFWSKYLVICVVQRIMHPGTVRQTQWLDPFNGDQRCDRWSREEDMLKNSKKVSNFQFLCLVQVTRIYIIFIYWALFWWLRVHRVARKQQFCKTYGPFLCWISMNCTTWLFDLNEHVHICHVTVNTLEILFFIVFIAKQ